MDKPWIYLITACLALSTIHIAKVDASASSQAQYMSSESRLITALLSGYDAAIRPAPDAHTTLHVGLDFVLHYITDVDMKKQDMISEGYLRLNWTDLQLTWSPEEHDGISAVQVAADQLWNPKVALYNSAEVAHDITTGDGYAHVTYRGEITWHQQTRYESTCSFRLRWYPKDSQTCQLAFVPWQQHAQAVRVQLYRRQPKLYLLYDNQHWTVQQAQAYELDAASEVRNATYSVVLYSYTLHRQDPYRSVLLVVMSTVIAIINIVSLWLPLLGKPTNAPGVVSGCLSVVMLVYLELLLPLTLTDYPIIGVSYVVHILVLCCRQASVYLCVTCDLRTWSCDVNTWSPHVRHRVSAVCERLVCCTDLYARFTDSNDSDSNKDSNSSAISMQTSDDVTARRSEPGNVDMATVARDDRQSNDAGSDDVTSRSTRDVTTHNVTPPPTSSSSSASAAAGVSRHVYCCAAVVLVVIDVTPIIAFLSAA